jgi:chromosome segregation ATPase
MSSNAPLGPFKSQSVAGILLAYNLKGAVMDNDRNVPATRGDLQELEARFNEKLEALEVRLETHFHEFEHRIEQLFSVMEARVVSTVYRLGEAAQQRLTAAEREAAAFKERLATLEQRLLDLEKRLDLPSQPIQ